MKHFSTYYSKAIASLLLISFFISSCTSPQSNNGKKVAIQKIETEIPISNPMTRTLNTKLVNLKTQADAESVIQEFVNYAAERFESPKNSKSTKSTTTNTDILNQFINVKSLAKREFIIRSKKEVRSQSLNPMVSLDDLKQSIEDSNPNMAPSIKELKTLQDGVRESVPNMAIDPTDSLMTPFESMVISWAYVTGDDGSLPKGSLGPLDTRSLENKVNQQEVSSAGIGWLVWGFFIAAITCGIHDAYANTEHKDIFGNKIYDDEEMQFCVKVKRGRRSVIERRTKKTRRYYYTYENLIDASNALEPYFETEAGSNSTGLALLEKHVDSFHTANESSSKYVNFPYSKWKPYLRKGDLIFMESDNAQVMNMSRLTHVAIFYSHEQLPDHPAQAFEAWPTGINLYDVGENWTHDLYFYVRRIGNTSPTKLADAVETAVDRYKEKVPFRPEMKTPNNGIQDPRHLPLVKGFLYHKKWGDKHDLSSMYCSKLVWHTFKDIKNNFGEIIDLDSNSTRIKRSSPSSVKPFAFPDRDDQGNIVSTAFIGVSPDDIFNSKYLDKNFELFISKHNYFVKL